MEYAVGLLCAYVCAVPQEKLKLVTLHVVDKTQLEGTYTGRVARALDVLMLCAGYGGQIAYKDFVWQQCYVQGRTLLTPKEMQDRWPSQWQLIVEALMPGMLDLAAEVERRGEHEPDMHEQQMRNQVSVSLYLLTAFLHGSSVHLYNHDTSPVFMALPLFREEWFRQWHREQFSPVVAELQMKAEVVSRHLTSINNRGFNVLAKAREDLGLPHDFHQPISRDAAEQLLHHAYGLVTNTALPAASTKQPPSEQPAPLPPVPAHTLAMPELCTFENLWHAWHRGWTKYAAIKLYFGEGAKPPGKARWNKGKKELQAFRRVEQLMLMLERQMKREHKSASEAADGVFRRWSGTMGGQACGVKWSVAKLASGFKELADPALKAELILSEGTKGSPPLKIARDKFVAAFCNGCL